MIYEAILYQGMTIDLNTQRKWVNTHTRTSSDADDRTHKSDPMSLRLQDVLFFLFFFFSADPSHLTVIHFNKHQKLISPHVDMDPMTDLTGNAVLCLNSPECSSEPSANQFCRSFTSQMLIPHIFPLLF